MEMTLEQAINNIGVVLASPELKLSQGEHLALIKSFEIVKKACTPLTPVE